MKKTSLPGIPPSSPTPKQILELRTAAHLTQGEAAELVHKTVRQWQRWEANKNPSIMSAAVWELFAAKLMRRGVEMPEYLTDFMACNWS